MEENSRIDNIASEAREYVDLKVDEIKLKATDGLAATLSHLTTTILLTTLMIIVLSTLAFGLVLLLGDIVGSYAAGCFIVCGVFAVLTVILFLNRKKLFRNSFVRMFINIFYDDDQI